MVQRIGEDQSDETFRDFYRLERERISQEVAKILGPDWLTLTEKRKNPRVPVSFPATCFLFHENTWDKKERQMHVLNLSASGMRIVSPERVPPAGFLFARFRFGKQPLIQILNRIVWVNKLFGQWICGIEFTNPTPEQQWMVDLFVAQERRKVFEEEIRKTGRDRRRYFRINSELSFPYSLYLGSLLNRWEKQGESLLLMDLSGDGGRIRCSKKLNRGQLLSFVLPLTEPLAVLAQVVWLKPEAEGQIQYGVKFVNLEERFREVIIKYVVFEEQQTLKSRPRNQESD